MRKVFPGHVVLGEGRTAILLPAALSDMIKAVDVGRCDGRYACVVLKNGMAIVSAYLPQSGLSLSSYLDCVDFLDSHLLPWARSCGASSFCVGGERDDSNQHDVRKRVHSSAFPSRCSQ